MVAAELASTHGNKRRLAEVAATLADFYLENHQFDHADEILSDLPDEVLAQGPLLVRQAELAWHQGHKDQALDTMEQANEIPGERWRPEQQARMEDFRTARNSPSIDQ